MEGALRYTLVEPVRQEPRVLLLALSTMFITMGQGIVAPILPLLVTSYGLSAAMAGVAVSAFALARVFANIPAGILTRGRGARGVLVVGAIFSAAGNLMVGLVPTYEALVAFRFVAGIGSAMYITAAVVFVAEVSSVSNRGRLMMVYQAAFLLGLTLGPPVGGLMAELAGFRAPFFLVAAISVLAAAWAMARIPAGVGRPDHGGPPEPKRPGASRRWWGSLPPVLADRSFIAINLVAMAVFLTRGAALFTLFPLMGAQRFALDVGQVGALLTVPAAANLVFQPLAGALADRLGRKALIVPTVLGFALSLAMAAASPALALLGLALAVYGVAQAVEAPAANAYVADLAPQGQRAMAVAVNRTVADVGLVVGGPVMGLAADHLGIPWALGINAALLLVPGALFLAMARETWGGRQGRTSARSGRVVPRSPLVAHNGWWKPGPGGGRVSWATGWPPS